MTTSDTPSQGIGLAEAAAQFGALLSGNTGKQTPEPASEENAPAEDAEALEATSHEDETLEADEAPAVDDAEDTSDEGSEDEDAAADDGEAEDAVDPMDTLYTVKLDGKDEQVPLRELLKGYQRTADYTRKTMAVSEQAKALGEQLQNVQTERSQYGELLSALAGQLQQQVAAEPDWDALYEQNPMEYMRQKDLHRERKEQFAAAQSELNRLATLQMQEQVEQISRSVQEGRAKLGEVIPAWRDENRWKADKAKIREYGKKIGFTDAELDKAYDHRAVLMLYKSMRFDELRANRPQPQKAKAPALARPNAPQTLPTRKASEVSRDKQRLAKTGSVNDAAKLFERLL